MAAPSLRTPAPQDGDRGHDSPSRSPAIRPARIDDVARLVEIEDASFVTDRLSRRQFRYMLTRAHARALVAEADDGTAAGYALVLFNRGTSLARLYSIAVDPARRGRGTGGRLLAAAENEARDEGAAYMRLEVRADDAATRRLYEGAGYRQFGVAADYYDDGCDAVRMEKALVPHLDPAHSRVPYYPQSLDFTCGPAALMMAMHALDPAVGLDATLELRLWRESTTIFMTAGHGGCSPYGLALAAASRGFHVEVFVREAGPLLLDSVRSAQKRDVMELVERDFLQQIRFTDIAIHQASLGIQEMRRRFDAGEVPVVLVSSYRFDRSKEPHWVVITGFDEGYVYLHDPFVDYEEDQTATDRMHIPVPLADFERMARYGRQRQRAALVIRRQEA